MESTSATAAPVVATNSKTRVLFASLVGTTIEFFDFYIYATAAVIIFPHLFFPASSGSAAVLQSLATFAIAFIARPIGAALFGHLGDRIGRKATLVAALLTMGISTVCIGLLPTYAQIGIVAPLLLALCRLGQGLGLGGEWSGAVLLATENAPEGKRAWYGMFPQLGAPIGFILATGSFLLLSAAIPEQAFMQWGWRIPFIASAVLVIVGLYIRLKLHETPAFQKVLDKQKEVNIPFKEVVTKHTGKLILGTIAAICTFVVFYLTTVFALNWGTTKLGYARGEFLELQLFATLCFAAFIPLSAIFAEKFGRKATSIGVCIAAAIFGLFFSSMLESGNTLIVFLFLCTGLSIMGLTYGPIGTVLSEIFPTSVRYTGSALTFNLAGIFGASFAPLIATKLAETYGLYAVGYYLTAASLLSLIAFLLIRETKNVDVNNQI
ncbi:TPA: MFS transporter [Acinetobacter baumannii]|jgi:metabolite-proton symporter|uniref:Inner membrane metabolite transport protein YhjE n=22 Tax=Acinetobacter calcoaceticus/baumannii complex TaxID=909768 RepID=A0ABX6CJA5_ACIB2|nr:MULTISPECIES: MFS transporter [Acinetobacter]ADX93747.1 major facilitator superfamily permease [Acinetobacter baumannii TCDC-AB0715]AHX28957.1 MFS transporter [Acinetobacter baumannii AC12]AHX65816.1 MFS transporter [Acinetobacter baumannii AC30]EMT86631.1 major facilitator superfamily permease [Acinetobacter baumannii ABNIH5]ETY68809.1 MFS transporter [Acinetobacter baumannii MDR_MMC4]EXB12523.1 H+ symporter family protein [Acinetobacter baumannii 1397084]EXC95611.1 H+ symporter family p